MPSAITGIRGSCVVIPCNYEFKNSQHSHINVRWYKFSSSGNPLVYDRSSSNIDAEFRGKTSLYGSSNEKYCSLKIQPLELQHQERLFPWMDRMLPEDYHRQNFKDVTIALDVTGTINYFTGVYLYIYVIYKISYLLHFFCLLIAIMILLEV